MFKHTRRDKWESVDTKVNFECWIGTLYALNRYTADTVRALAIRVLQGAISNSVPQKDIIRYART